MSNSHANVEENYNYLKLQSFFLGIFKEFTNSRLGDAAIASVSANFALPSTDHIP